MEVLARIVVTNNIESGGWIEKLRNKRPGTEHSCRDSRCFPFRGAVAATGVKEGVCSAPDQTISPRNWWCQGYWNMLIKLFAFRSMKPSRFYYLRYDHNSHLMVRKSLKNCLCCHLCVKSQLEMLIYYVYKLQFLLGASASFYGPTLRLFATLYLRHRLLPWTDCLLMFFRGSLNSCGWSMPCHKTE